MILVIDIELIHNDEFFERLIYKGEETIYMVSNYGRIWSLKHKKFISVHIGNKGRRKVHLYLNGKGKTIELARVIALTFLGDGEGLEADHIDNDPLNDVLSNIQWLTPFENKSKAHQSGNIKYAEPKRGEESENSKYSEKVIRQACSMMEIGKNSKEIHNETGLPIPVIYSLYQEEKWTHVTCEYNVKNMSKAPIERIPSEIGNFINEKIKEGLSNKEIENILEIKFGLTNTYNSISNRRRRIKKGEI